MSKIPDLQVVIPYKTLVSLLAASEEIPVMKEKIELRDQQLAALRHQFTELMEAFGELKKFVSD